MQDREVQAYMEKSWATAHTFDPKSKNIYSPKAEGVTEVIRYALEESRIFKEKG